MFKHTISELKEALVCLQAGKATLGYPFEPHAPEGDFRGKPVVDANLCIGCGACANACPPRLITLTDEDGYRHISFELARCTYCGSCRDVCPVHAVTMSDQFETATPNITDLNIDIKLKTVTCRECGAVVGTVREIQHVKSILNSKNYVETSHLDMCIPCKRSHALSSAAWMKEVTR